MQERAAGTSTAASSVDTLPQPSRSDGSTLPSSVAELVAKIGKGLQYQKQRQQATVFVAFDAKNLKKRKRRRKGEKEEDLHQERSNSLESQFAGDTNSGTWHAERPNQSNTLVDYNQTRETEQRDARRGIWNADSHLFLWSRASRCVDIFATSSLARIHPAVLDELNLNQYFVVDGCGADATPLSLSITTAICVGAAAAGEKNVELEFWNRARQQVGSLFDVSDFHVAAALQQLSEYAIRKGFEEQGVYYATLGVSICEQLNKINTGVYMWLLVSLYLGASPAPSTYWAKLQNTAYRPPLLLPSSETNVASKIASASPEQIELDALGAELTVHVAGTYAQVTLDPYNQHLMEALDEVLTSLEHQWAAVRHIFIPGQRLALDLGLSATVAAVKRNRGRYDEALDAAIVFTERAQDPLFPYILVLKQGTFHPLKVLLETKNYFILHSLLTVLKPKNDGTFLDGLLEEFKPFLYNPPPPPNL